MILKNDRTLMWDNYQQSDTLIKCIQENKNCNLIQIIKDDNFSFIFQKQNPILFDYLYSNLKQLLEISFQFHDEFDIAFSSFTFRIVLGLIQVDSKRFASIPDFYNFINGL